MKLETKQLFIKQMDQVNWLCLKLDNNQLDELNRILNNDKKETIVDVSNEKVKRSLSANAYAFKLMSKIAKLLTTTTEEVYEQMLQDRKSVV